MSQFSKQSFDFKIRRNFEEKTQRLSHKMDSKANHIKEAKVTVLVVPLPCQRAPQPAPPARMPRRLLQPRGPLCHLSHPPPPGAAPVSKPWVLLLVS